LDIDKILQHILQSDVLLFNVKWTPFYQYAYHNQI